MPSLSFISIGQLAARTGLAVSAIRYYETQGLIEALRNSGGHRRFLRSDIRRLSFIMIAQRFGFSIAEIREKLTALPNGRTPTPADWQKMGEGFREDLHQRIATLERLRDNLDGCIGCGCLSLPRCALYNKGDSAGQKGVGPRYLMGDKANAADSTQEAEK
ncbi:UNVERIFIED_CONTAM: hypothetical protein GTU68_018814 [Idotea baltica]|nr:hypothetical protein [Idotea baltica]